MTRAEQEYTAGLMLGLAREPVLRVSEWADRFRILSGSASAEPGQWRTSRTPYLREIMGDTDGAIEAMKLAVSCGYPGHEQSEWTRCQLGRLYENTGRLDYARLQYALALHFIACPTIEIEQLMRSISR